jgi:hypothetical protein
MNHIQLHNTLKVSGILRHHGFVPAPNYAGSGRDQSRTLSVSSKGKWRHHRYPPAGAWAAGMGAFITEAKYDIIQFGGSAYLGLTYNSRYGNIILKYESIKFFIQRRSRWWNLDVSAGWPWAKRAGHRICIQSCEIFAVLSPSVLLILPT